MEVSVSELKLNEIKGPNLTVIENSDSGSIKLNIGSPTDPPKKAVNFGPGADLFMNQNKRNETKSPKSNIVLDDLGDITSFDLNNSVGSSLSEKREKMFSGTAGLNLSTPTSSEPSLRVNFSETNNILPNASNGKSFTETSDGFKSFNDIPVNPDIKPQPTQPRLSNEEALKEKLKYLRKLEDLEKKGVVLSKKYSMESSLLEMKGEFELIKSEKEKKNSVKFQGKMLMAFISGLEFLNNKFDPFDLQLDGWSEAVNENIDEYDDVFSELHEKYKGKAKMAPELKLLFMLGGSGAMLHMTNTMFKSSMPGMDDIMRQNPELMQQFTQAAASSMSDTNPGFSNFMNNFRSEPSHEPPRGAPPGPTEYQRRNPPRANFGGPNRPDIGFNRGQAEFGDAVNMSSKTSVRKEMKGPSDLNDLLSGLKTKKINIKNTDKDSGSVVSITELKELQSTKLDKGKPKKSKRKKSERNTVELNFQ